jgi:hypothetical protein
MNWEKIGSLIFSGVSAAAALGCYVVVLQIKNAILTERDLMKTWVEAKIAMSEENTRRAWRN